MPKLLILVSNPRRDLSLDREVSDLNKALQRLGDFEVVLGLKVRSQKLQELLAEQSLYIFWPRCRGKRVGRSVRFF